MSQSNTIVTIALKHLNKVINKINRRSDVKIGLEWLF